MLPVSSGRPFRFSGIIALLLFPLSASPQHGAIAEASIAHSSAPARPAASVLTPAPKVGYEGRLLYIHASGTTVAEILTDIAAVTGVKIEIPADAASEPLPVVDIGPAPARQVLSELLSDSQFDYLVQSSDVDSDSIQAVILMPRGKQGREGDAVARDRFGNPRSSRALAPQESEPPPPAPDSVPANMQVTPADQTPEPPPPRPANSSSTPVLQGQQNPAFGSGSLSPPAVVNRETASQQLQLMYQQRMQMNQQQNPSAPAGK